MLLVNENTGAVITIRDTSPVVLGRGPLTNCSDPRASRRHAEVKKMSDDTLMFTALHPRPCHVMIQGNPPVKPLRENEKMEVHVGDMISFLPDAIWFRIALERKTPPPPMQWLPESRYSVELTNDDLNNPPKIPPPRDGYFEVDDAFDKSTQMPLEKDVQAISKSEGSSKSKDQLALKTDSTDSYSSPLKRPAQQSEVERQSVKKPNLVIEDTSVSQSSGESVDSFIVLSALMEVDNIEITKLPEVIRENVDKTPPAELAQEEKKEDLETNEYDQLTQIDTTPSDVVSEDICTTPENTSQPEFTEVEVKKEPPDEALSEPLPPENGDHETVNLDIVKKEEEGPDSAAVSNPPSTSGAVRPLCQYEDKCYSSRAPPFTSMAHHHQKQTAEQKKVIVELLQVYKEFRCLWDIRSDNYTDRKSRISALYCLLEIYRKIYPQATLRELKKKLENMRCAYKREVRKVESTEATSKGTSDVYLPRLWYFKHMRFLDDKESAKNEAKILEDEEGPVRDGNTGNVPAAFETSTSTFKSQFTTRETSISVPQKKARIDVLERKNEQIDSVKNSLSYNENEWEVIGRSLGLQLSKLTENQQTIAQKLISDIIFFGRKEKLTDFSNISLSPSPHTTYPNPQPPYSQPCASISHVSPPHSLQSTNSSSSSPPISLNPLSSPNH